MSNINLKEAASFLNERDGFVVFTHANPDGDTIGSATALVLMLRSIGKKAAAVCADPIPAKLSFIKTENVFIKELPQHVETAISVDVASQAILGSLGAFCDGRAFDLSIDHHKVNSVPCHRLLVMNNYISNGEIIYELALCMGIKLDINIATALYGAICSDSGGFKYLNTRAETYEYAADMIRAGVDFVRINKMLFDEKTPKQIALERMAYNTLSLHYDGKLAIVAVDEHTVEELCVTDSDFDVLNQIPRQIMGVEVSAVLRPRNGGTKVSLRSNEYFDVAEFARQHGGGGHIHAAGYSFGSCVKDATEALIKDLNGVF